MKPVYVHDNFPKIANLAVLDAVYRRPLPMQAVPEAIREVEAGESLVGQVLPYPERAGPELVESYSMQRPTAVPTGVPVVEDPGHQGVSP